MNNSIIKKANMTMLFLSFLLILIPNVLSIGISPSKTNINFVPNLNIERYFKIINQENINISVKLSVSGELSQFISLENQTIKLFSGQPESKAYFKIKMPSTYNAGLHNAKIKVMPLLNSQHGFSAMIALNHNVNLYVPPEYSQLLINFTYKQPFLIIYMENPRNETINNVDLKAQINENNKIEINDLKFQSEETKKLIKKIDSLKNGKYLISYSIFSNRFNFTNTRNIIIGKKDIDITMLNLKNLYFGQINKIPILLENKWNENSTLNINMILRKAAKIYVESNTTVNLLPYEKKSIDLYLESQTVNKGNYTISLQIFFDKQSKQIKEFVDLKTPSLIKPNKNSISKLQMSALIMTLVLLGVLLHLIWRKK
jgi:hypothetical protein